MPIHHSSSAGARQHEAQKVNARVAQLIGDSQRLDFSRPFLPNALAHTVVSWLTPAERLTLNQIRGATYLHLSGLVEEIVLPFIVERARAATHDKARVRTLLNFAEEEARHQQRIERAADELKRGLKARLKLIGPVTTIATEVLKHSPLAVAILTLHLECLAERHAQECAKTDERLDVSFVGLIEHRQPEHQAKLDTLLTDELARHAGPDEVLDAVDEFLEIAEQLDALLQQQVVYDREALERVCKRRLSSGERQQLEEAQLRSYRFAYLGAGLEHESFLRTLGQLSQLGQARVYIAARAFSLSA
jgi:hypothetical protein